MSDQTDHDHNHEIEEVWRAYLTTGIAPKGYEIPLLSNRQLYKLVRSLPSDPRCRICQVPFSGIGGTLWRTLFGRRPSKLNPEMCNVCELFADQYQGGAEVELSMLFADVRGSTHLAEHMSPSEFKRLIERFYKASTAILYKADALVGKLIGDGVNGLFTQGFAGPDHARVAVEAAKAILRDTAAWLPVGVGVHTGVAYVGAVGGKGDVIEITALGDAVNVAARLASQAEAGEVLVSEATRAAAGLDTAGMQSRPLQLKGRSESVEVWALRVQPDTRPNIAKTP